MRTKTGTVLSTGMNKTIVVTVDSYKTHPKYKKRYRVSKKYYAHDENNVSKTGDTVTIYETRPLSKLKRWTVTKPE
jgi:small subunit ribosomal protein S17